MYEDMLEFNGVSKILEGADCAPEKKKKNTHTHTQRSLHLLFFLIFFQVVRKKRDIVGKFSSFFSNEVRYICFIFFVYRNVYRAVSVRARNPTKRKSCVP